MSHSEEHQNLIPVIDISDPSEEVAQQVLDAASTHGFLYIKNDGVTISPHDIDDMFKLVRSNATPLKCVT
jgi:isopenicillin N synthase-like dioxygenase